MAKEYLFIPSEMLILEGGKMIFFMEKEFIPSKLDKFTKDNSFKEKKKVEEYTTIIMDKLNIVAAGKMIKNMVKEYSTVHRNIMKENGILV